MTIDLHFDTLWQMTKHGYYNLTEKREYAQVSESSLKEGGLDTGVFALYLRKDLETYSEELISQQLDFYHNQQIPRMLGLEGGGVLEGKLARLYTWAAREKIAYFTLLHNYDNKLGCSATDSCQRGLTRFGKEVIAACNELGILVDVSHASEQTAWEIIEYSQAPVIASHSGVKGLVNHPRNLSDEVIKAIARSGGVIGVPFVKKFVGTCEGIPNHIDYIAQLVGVDCVAIGSDIDGAVLVDGVGVSNWFNTLNTPLQQRGYSRESIRKITGENFLSLSLSTGKEEV